MKILGKPVTVERIKDAYQAIDYKPLTRDWIQGDRCCALSAVFLAEGGSRGELIGLTGPANDLPELFKVEDDDEIFAFTAGFDGFTGFEGVVIRNRIERFPEAYKLGQEVRRAILGE